jgi:purine-binding chemotaxis protein CheW
MRPLPIEPFGKMPHFVRGVAVVRGEPIPVVDAAMLLGSAALRQPGRFVTLRANDHSVALAVDEVLGLRELSTASMRDLPPLLRGGSGDIGSTIGTLDAELLIVLRAARVLPDDAWNGLVTRGGVA